MSDQDFEFNLGRWLVWGLLGLVGFIVVMFILSLLLRSGDSVSETPDVEQVEWSIQTSEYTPTPGLVTLKGDAPLGFPTETWKDGVMLLRSVDARQFEWNMDIIPEVPVPVYEIDQAEDCDELTQHLEEWAAEVGSAPGEGQRVQASAFAQHAFDTLVARDCTLP